MRRRTWALVRMSDVVFSHQVSLPNMIYEHDCDTQLPNNIFDEEFGPDTKVLPPSRPSSEPTPIAYMIAKSKLCVELGSILQTTNRVGRQVPYDDILRFDSKLRDIIRELPPHLKLIPLDGSHDPVTLIIARFNVDILYQRIMCLLHRKYLPRARQNPRYAHSRRSAIEASLEALRHLATLQRESQASGRLRSIKWYVTSIATKDFLLPAMLVVLDLHFDNVAERTQERRDSESAFFWTPEQRSEMVSSLETTRDIWMGLADTSVEAWKASKVLDIMLDKIKCPASPIGDNKSTDPAPVKSDLFSNFGSSDLQPEHSAAMTLGMLSGSMSPNTASAFNSLSGSGSTPFSSLEFGLGAGSGLVGMGPEFQGADAFAANNAGSPFSMFGNLGTGADLSGAIDWVNSPPSA
jgi:hypothetical protein